MGQGTRPGLLINSLTIEAPKPNSRSLFGSKGVIQQRDVRCKSHEKVTIPWSAVVRISLAPSTLAKASSLQLASTCISHWLPALGQVARIPTSVQYALTSYVCGPRVAYKVTRSKHSSEPHLCMHIHVHTKTGTKMFKLFDSFLVVL